MTLLCQVGSYGAGTDDFVVSMYDFARKDDLSYGAGTYQRFC